MSAANRGMGFLPEKDGQYDDLVVGDGPDAQRIGRNRDASEDLLTGAAPIPSESFALVPVLPLFRDQEDTSTCLPTTALNVAESSLAANGGGLVEPGSIPHLYSTANALSVPAGAKLEDTGAYGRIILQVLREWGVAPDKVWPLRDPKTRRIIATRDASGRIVGGPLVERAPPHVHQRASSWKLDEQLTIYSRDQACLDTVAASIAQRSGIIACGPVDGLFMYYNGRGVLGASKLSDFRGNHAVAIVGFRTNPTTKRREYLIRNSWSMWGLVYMKQPSMAWVDEEWVLSQRELYRLRVSRGRRTS